MQSHDRYISVQHNRRHAVCLTSSSWAKVLSGSATLTPRSTYVRSAVLLPGRGVRQSPHPALLVRPLLSQCG
jgi:hypothetical protein